MGNRRAHSSIDKLPADLREALVCMIVDNAWPVDFPRAKALGFGGDDKEPEGNPRYADMVTYCKHKGHAISESAVGRFAVRMRVLAKMKQAGVVVRDEMKDLTAENASATQKAVAEIITAQLIEAASRDNLSPKMLKDLATAVRDCTAVSISADKYVREQIAKKVDTAAENMKKRIGKAGGKRKAIQKIIDEELGVIKKS